jgi:hypothetical protein
VGTNKVNYITECKSLIALALAKPARWGSAALKGLGLILRFTPLRKRFAHAKSERNDIPVNFAAYLLSY